MRGEVYLHDGLYASFDGWQVVLRAPRDGGDHWIGLEPETMRALMRFLRALEAEHGNVPVAAAATDMAAAWALMKGSF